jgi:hypothetical protein
MSTPKEAAPKETCKQKKERLAARVEELYQL